MKALVITVKVIVPDDTDAHTVRRLVADAARSRVATVVASALQCERKARPSEVHGAASEVERQGQKPFVIDLNDHSRGPHWLSDRPGKEKTP